MLPRSRTDNGASRRRCSSSSRITTRCVLAMVTVLSNFHYVEGFVVSPTFHHISNARRGTFLSSTTDEQRNHVDALTADDQKLLLSIRLEQLTDLCSQYQLPTEGTKEGLLLRLRQFANDRAEQERQRILNRTKRVEEGSDDTKERYEIVDGGDEDEDDEEDDFFFFALPDDAADSDSSEDPSSTLMESTKSKANPPSKATPPKSNQMDSRTIVTAPPPPTEPNEKGERVVQIYSTTDQNDLTGVAAAQPGYHNNFPDTTSSGGAANANQPWDREGQANRHDTSTEELEHAKGEVYELITLLLASTGAPVFVSLAEDTSIADDNVVDIPKEFVGFHPGVIPTELLTKASKALRSGRGQVLDESLRQFEMQAIGQDGVHGDDIEKGGGHYRQVQKVRAFLGGYRRAEVRRLARETTALLLDKLVQEGVEGLDMTLATMTRSSDDTNEHAGELNDSLLDYLNDAIRQQEKKVAATANTDPLPAADAVSSQRDEVDSLNGLWNVTVEDGQRVESIDPNDPHVKRVLQEEYIQSELVESPNGQASEEKSAPEQLLLLLTLLRERIKVEAAFAPDEKGRNLRLLAYCLRLDTEAEREQLILREIGNSLDRLDSFLELVASSIEYGESTSYQLQPAKTTQPLNLGLLRSILELVEELRDRQSFKASGIKAVE